MNRTDPRFDELVRNTLARARSLQQRRALRNATQCFWLEGVRQFVQAFESGTPIDTVVRSPVLLRSSWCDKLARQLVARGVRRVDVTPEQFRSVCTAERASGIAAIATQFWTPLSQLRAGTGLCWIVVDSLRSAGNLGTILRTAEATGVGGVIFLSGACDPFDPAVVRASMGGIFHLKLARTNPAAYRRWARSEGVTTVGLSPGAAHAWTDAPFAAPVALLLGEERHGLSPAAEALCDVTAKLPMTGRADSLNVGVAAGVMMYELIRRRAVQTAFTTPTAATP